MSIDDTRSRILNAAGPVFAEKGHQAATVREICQAAGVNVASVNYHFGDKKRLYIETVRQAQQRRIEQVPLPQRPQGTPAETRLQDFVLTLLTRMRDVEETSWESRLMLREVLQPTGACRQMVEDYFRPHFELLLAILAELLPAATPRHRRYQIGYSIIGQCLFYRVAGEVVGMITPEDDLWQHFRTEQLAEHIAQLCLAALGAGPPFSAAPEKESCRDSS